ncbi:MAG: 3-isopropylmalate dehydratase large subunit [Rikenellaceae bacterium]
MLAKTLFDKVWDAHVVESLSGGRDVLYIDRHYIHEVTSPVAFLGLKDRGLKVFRPAQTTAAPDHNIPTQNQHLPIEEPQSAQQVASLLENCKENGIELWGLNHPKHGIIHVIGPEQGLTQPGMTMVCGDSHTSTHGAVGAVAFGVGTSEVEMVFASQTILQPKPKKMKITVDGELAAHVEAKDVVLYIISKISASGGTGHFIEFAGSAIRSLSMDGRLTVCNMSIECGARGGMIAPDATTFEYLKGRPFAPKGEDWEKKMEYWATLFTDEDAVFDMEYKFDAADIRPMVTFGTNPGMGMAVEDKIPSNENLSGSDKESYQKALEYMGFKEGEEMVGKKVDYVFVGSCTNGRIEDFRHFAAEVKGKKKCDDVVVWLVPGSKEVERVCDEEGITQTLIDAGFELRQPGCSACLAMNNDKIPAGKYALSTSNRNFEGRQGPGARTMLCGVKLAAAAALTGVIGKL